MRRLLAALLLIAAPVAAQSPAPRFRAGAEVIAIDVTVVDRDGAPVAGLTASDFDVRVEGKPRDIASAQFLRAETSPRISLPDESSNTEPASGRLLLIVTDELSLRNESHAVVAAAGALLKHLAPGDLAGVARVPDGGGVPFTTDRARVIAELKRLRPPTARVARTDTSVFISEALDFDGQQRFQWPLAMKRECGEEADAPSYRHCIANLEQAARLLLIEASMRTNDTVRGLERLMKTLEATGQPVTVVLISDGMVLARDPGALAGLAEACAEARVTLHVIQPAPPTAAMSARGFASDPVGDAALNVEGLEQMAARTRGAMHRVVSTGESTFERIGREVSGYYLLGIEPDAEDRKHRRRRVDVQVRKPGVTVRARSMFTLTRAGATPAADAPGRLRQMLEAPVAARGLPIRVTTRKVSGGNNQVRVLIAAEIGEPTDQRTAYHVGVIAITAEGQVRSRSAATTTLAPARDGRQSPSLFTTSLLLDPGDYSLRLAAADSSGRSGSVHHALDARLRAWPDGWHTSDLIVANRPAPGEFPPFNASSIVDTDQVAAVIDVVHDKAEALNRVTVSFELDGGRHDATAEPASSQAGRHVRSFAALLEPTRSGEHRLRVTVTPPGSAPITLERSFAFEPIDADPFSASTIRGYIEQLERRHAISPSLAQFVAAAKDGRFVEAPGADRRSDADLAMVTFVGGVAALLGDKPALARVLLQQTLRAAPGFEGAVYYLALIR